VRPCANRGDPVAFDVAYTAATCPRASGGGPTIILQMAERHQVAPRASGGAPPSKLVVPYATVRPRASGGDPPLTRRRRSAPFNFGYTAYSNDIGISTLQVCE
jgi:hypothetical protein